MPWNFSRRVFPVAEVVTPLVDAQSSNKADAVCSSSSGDTAIQIGHDTLPLPPKPSGLLADTLRKRPAWAAFDNPHLHPLGGCPGAVLQALSADAAITAVCTSQDGSRLAVGGDSNDPRVLVYCLETQQLLGQFTGNHEGGVTQLAFYPSDPSRLVSVGQGSASILHWSLASPHTPLHVLRPATSGEPVAEEDAANWSLESLSASHCGQFVGSTWRHYRDNVTALAVHSLVSGSNVLWVQLPVAAAPAGKAALRAWEYVRFAPCALAGHGPVMAAGNARTTQLWDAAAGERVAELGIDLEEVFTSIVSWSGNGQRLALGTLNAAQVWDVSCAAKPVKLQSCCFPSSRASYLCGALDPTGRMLAVACGQQLAICHISSGAVPQPDTPVPPAVQVVCVRGDLAERGSEVQAVRWVAEGRQLLTADARGGCYLWSPDSGALLWDLSTSEDQHGSLGQDCCAVAAPGGCVARGTSCGMLLVHSVAPAVQQLVPVFTLPTDIRCMEVSSDGKVAVAACRDGRLVALDTSTGAVLIEAQQAAGEVVAVTPDQALVAVADTSGVRLRRIAPGFPLVQLLTVPASWGQAATAAEALAISPNGQLLAALHEIPSYDRGYDRSSRGGTLLSMWSLQGGQMVATEALGSSHRLTSICFSADSTELLAVKNAKQAASTAVMSWETATWARLPVRLEFDGAPRNPQLQRLLQCSGPSSQDLWAPDVQRWGKFAGSKGIRGRGLRCLARSHSGQLFALTSDAYRLAVCDAGDFNSIHWVSELEQQWWDRHADDVGHHVTWSPDDRLLLASGRAGITVVNAQDGVIICHCSTEPCSWAHMLPGNGWLLAVHQPCSLDVLMGCMERPSGPQRRTAVLWSALVHGGVAPDAGLLQAMYIQPALLTPLEEQPLEQLVAMHPGLLQLTDAEGMSLAMAALVHSDEGLFSALCKAAGKGSQTLRLVSARAGGAALQALEASGNAELMQALIQALGEGKVETAQQPELFWSLLGSIASRNTQLAVDYLKECLVALGDVQLQVPVRQDLALVSGLCSHPAGAPAALWTAPGAVHCLPPAGFATGGGGASVGAREVCKKQWFAAAVLPLQGAAMAPLPGQMSLLRGLSAANPPADVFGLDAVRAIVNIKWEVYGRGMVLFELLLHILLLGVFAVYALLLHRAVDALMVQRLQAPDGGASWGMSEVPAVLACLVAALLLATRTLVLEWRQWRVTGVGAAITSTWNLLDVGSLLLFLPITGLTLAVTPLNPSADSPGQCYAALLVMCAVNSVLLWGRMLHYMRAFQATGPMVRMIMEIVKDIKYFLLLLACMALGFGMAFFLLFSATQVARGAATDNSDLDNYFGSIPRTMVTMLSMMTGNFDQNLFWQAQAPWLAVLLFVVYVLLMVVVLFNLLIAIMGDSFSKIKSTEEVEFLKGRAQVLDEIEASMSASTIRQLNQRLQDYVHTLVPSTAPKPSQPPNESSNKVTAAEGIKAMIWALDKQEILPLISNILAELQEPSLQE